MELEDKSWRSATSDWHFLGVPCIAKHVPDVVE